MPDVWVKLTDFAEAFRSNTRYIGAIKANRDVPTSEIIKALIDNHKGLAEWQRTLYERYKATSDGVPIFNRQLVQNENAGKINNKLNNDFPGEIVDTKVGYFIGNPISYVSGEGETPEEIKEFNRNNDVEDLDAETVKMAAITGLAARLLYINPEGREAVKCAKPWECVFLYEDSIIKPDYAMRYYAGYDELGRAATFVEWYTPGFVAFFRAVGENPFTEYAVRKVHRFGACPLFGIPNNEELQSDFQKVISLVDAYDRALSDVNSEIEQLRLAYMVVRGLIVGENEDETQQFLRKLQQTGLIEIDAEGEVKFITKEINAEFIEKHLDRLEKRITQGAKTVNFSDEAFGGNLSGVALKYKLFNLETKCMYLQNKLTKALRHQFRMLANSWKGRTPFYTQVANAIKGTKAFDPNSLEFKFTRNVFVDYSTEADVLGKLTGLISTETAYSLMSFIPNPRAEMEKKQQEIEEFGPVIDLDDAGDEDDEEEGDDGKAV